MADMRPRTPGSVELLPPEKSTSRQAVSQTNSRPPAVAWLPPPLIARVLDKIATKNAKAYADLVATQNSVVALLTEQLRLQEQFEVQLGRMAALPLLKSAATAQVFAEVEQIFDNINHETEMRRIRQETERLRAARELEELKRGPLPALPAPTREPRRPSRADRIKAIRKECEDIIAMLREGRTDNDLDAETLRDIEDCRYHANRRIKAILEED